MRTTLDGMIVSLYESLNKMVDALDRLLLAAYAPDNPQRGEVVAGQQQEIDHTMAAMESLIVDVLATQQPVLATDLSVVKGLLLASRQVGHIAHEQRDLATLMDQLGIADPDLPPEVIAVLPELRQVLKEAIAAFLHDDRILASFTFERVQRLERILQSASVPEHPQTLVPVRQLHLFALHRLLAAAREIARSAPLYRYETHPA